MNAITRSFCIFNCLIGCKDSSLSILKIKIGFSLSLSFHKGLRPSLLRLGS